MKRTAVVILNWNGKSWLEKFLPTVIQYTPNAQIVVADNASTDDSISFLKDNYPTVTIIQNETNGGFAKGYNDALKKVDAEFYMLLNSDVEVTENWLSPLEDIMQDINVAVCQPKIIAQTEKNKFEHAGAAGGFIDRNYYPFCRGRIMDLTEEDQGQYDSNIEVFWATGACFMIRSDVFHKEGGFDEDFFAHMEEIDLCWRIKQQGHKIVSTSKSKVYHVGGGTLTYVSPKKTYLNFRNSLVMLIKNHQGLLFPKLFYRMVLDGVAGLKFLLGGELKNFVAVLDSHFWLYRNLGKTLKKRKAQANKRKTFNPVGIYKGSILWAFYFKRITKFSELNQRLFK